MYEFSSREALIILFVAILTGATYGNVMLIIVGVWMMIGEIANSSEFKE